MTAQKLKQHWLALAILLAVAGLFLLLILVPIAGAGLDYHEEKSNLLFKMQKQQKIAARKELTMRQLESLRQRIEQQKFFNQENTESLVSADLQNLVKTAVTDAGGQLNSTQGIPGKTENGFTRVAVRVRLTATTETLRNLLNTIGDAVPLMIIDQIDITPLRGVHNRNMVKPEVNSQLNISFQVMTFMRGGKS